MARAYIVQARNDVQNLLLQVPDLVPNTSQRNSIYDPQGQSGYVSYFHLTDIDTVSATDTGDGTLATDDDYYGLVAYLMDTVENVGGGNLSLTVDEASEIAGAIGARAAAGLSLSLSDINTLINAPAGVSDSDLDGTVAGSDSRGSVEDLLKILSGAVYKVPAGTEYAGTAGAFPVGDASGFFVTSPSVTRTLTHPGGRRGSEPLNAGTVVSEATADSNYRNVREVVDTDDLHRSVLSGRLSALVSSSFVFLNPSFSYGDAGTALTIAVANIDAEGTGRAVTVYAADGSVIG